MALPGSNSQRDRLGARLATATVPAPDDLEALHELLGWYAESLDRATPRMLASTGLAPTSRVKNTGTILEKLRRTTGSSLSSTQDLAGARIVGEFRTAAEQDAVIAALVREFADAPKASRVVDRRARPTAGYRAVHVIVHPDGAPIEIQVRSALQHGWAERFEKVADLVGRDVRYGGSPTFPGLTPAQAGDPRVRAATERVLGAMAALSRMVAVTETRAAEGIGPRLAISDRSIITRAFADVDRTIGQLERAIPMMASLAGTPVE